jgi:hypothetical protein
VHISLGERYNDFAFSERCIYSIVEIADDFFASSGVRIRNPDAQLEIE